MSMLCTSIYCAEQCLYTKKAKMLQESYPPALTILREYIPVWTQNIQNVILVFDSIVHTSYMGCTDRHTWKWYTQIISSTHVQGMCMYTHSMNVYMQCMYMVHTTKSVQAHTRFNQLFQQETDDRLGNLEGGSSEGKEPALSWDSPASQGWSGLMRSEVWLWSCTAWDVSVLCTYTYLQSCHSVQVRCTPEAGLRIWVGWRSDGPGISQGQLCLWDQDLAVELL